MVKQIAGLSFSLNNARGVSTAGLEIKTNALTARGGFAEGGRAPDTDRYNRAVLRQNERNTGLLEDIKRTLGRLTEG